MVRAHCRPEHVSASKFVTPCFTIPNHPLHRFTILKKLAIWEVNIFIQNIFVQDSRLNHGSIREPVSNNLLQKFEQIL